MSQQQSSDSAPADKSARPEENLLTGNPDDPILDDSLLMGLSGEESPPADNFGDTREMEPIRKTQLEELNENETSDPANERDLFGVSKDSSEGDSREADPGADSQKRAAFFKETASEGESARRKETSQKETSQRGTSQRKKTARRSGKPRGEELTYSERIRRHRGRIILAETLLAILLIAAVTAAVFAMKNRHYTRAEFTKMLDYLAEEGTSYANLDGCLLQYGPNGVACADAQGSTRWSITYEMEQPIVSTCGNKAALADYGGRTVYIMDTKKQLGTISTSLPIHKVRVSSGGYVAVIMDDSSESWIRLYRPDGQEFAYFVRSLSENGYPMDVAVSPDGSTVAVSSLVMNQATVKSVVSFYSFGSAGQDSPDHLIGSYTYDSEVFPYLEFVSSDNCMAVSDSRFVVFDSVRTQPKNGINNMVTESIIGVYRGDKCIGLLFTDLSGESMYRLDLYDMEGHKAGSVSFTMAYTDIQIVGNYVYINNESNLRIYALDGREVFDGPLEMAVKALIPSSRPGSLTAVTEKEIDRITLK